MKASKRRKVRDKTVAYWRRMWVLGGGGVVGLGGVEVGG